MCGNSQGWEIGINVVGKKGYIIRQTLLPFTYYALTLGSIGYSIVWYSQDGLFNLGTFIAVAIGAAAIYIISTNQKKLSLMESNKNVAS